MAQLRQPYQIAIDMLKARIGLNLVWPRQVGKDRTSINFYQCSYPNCLLSPRNLEERSKTYFVSNDLVLGGKCKNCKFPLQLIATIFNENTDEELAIFLDRQYNYAIDTETYFCGTGLVMLWWRQFFPGFPDYSYMRHFYNNYLTGLNDKGTFSALDVSNSTFFEINWIIRPLNQILDDEPPRRFKYFEKTVFWGHLFIRKPSSLHNPRFRRQRTDCNKVDKHLFDEESWQEDTLDPDEKDEGIDTIQDRVIPPRGYEDEFLIGERYHRLLFKDSEPSPDQLSRANPERITEHAFQLCSELFAQLSQQILSRSDGLYRAEHYRRLKQFTEKAFREGRDVAGFKCPNCRFGRDAERKRGAIQPFDRDALFWRWCYECERGWEYLPGAERECEFRFIKFDPPPRAGECAGGSSSSAEQPST